MVSEEDTPPNPCPTKKENTETAPCSKKIPGPASNNPKRLPSPKPTDSLGKKTKTKTATKTPRLLVLRALERPLLAFRLERLEFTRELAPFEGSRRVGRDAERTARFCQGPLEHMPSADLSTVHKHCVQVRVPYLWQAEIHPLEWF